jgi:uncharacterized membrane protein YhhN
MKRKTSENPETRYHMAGWILFVICALFFIAASFRSGDWLTFIGSILFLFACIVFMIPLFRPGSPERK